MNRNIIYLLGLTILFSSCSFVGNVNKYSKTSKELINSIVNEDYTKAYDFFAYNESDKMPLDTFKVQIDNFRELIIDNFGTNFDLSFTLAEKTTFKTGEPGPHPTKVQIQLKNDSTYGYFTVLFDDEVNKVSKISLMDTKNVIPSMTLFWLFGLLPLLVFGFNIYTIRRVSKSDLNKKWLKIIGIIILNVPALTYSVVNGFKIEPLNFQIFLGISFGMMGYVGTFWTFGLPIGSIIANIKISKSKKSINSGTIKEDIE